VCLLSWLLDAPAAPSGVHGMVLAGKAAGKNVGMWFGPSAAAAGALRFVYVSFVIRFFGAGDGIGVPELHIFLGYL
jgi:cysteine protease ATG4